MEELQDRSAEGRPLRLLGTHTDIDAVKAAEIALPDINTTLEARVAERMQGDERMLDCALINLLDNAWKYTGATTTPAIRAHWGEVRCLRGVCVSDNGAGFDRAHAERWFKPFQRMHRQDDFPGIGIGLPPWSASCTGMAARSLSMRCLVKKRSSASLCRRFPAAHFLSACKEMYIGSMTRRLCR